jgi:hypothetical protein
MAALPQPQPPERDFQAVRSDLENVLAKLKESASGSMQRRSLLRELNLLLEEAHFLIAEGR